MIRSSSFLTAAFLACSLVLMNPAHALSSHQERTNQVDANGKKQGYWKITAKAGSHPGYKLGVLVEEGTYSNNRRSGVWKRYWPNGKVKSEINYERGIPKGPYKTYYPSGKVEELGAWDLDRNTGDFKRYHPNGKLAQDFKFNEYGLRDGKQKYYHENGTLAVEVDIKEGKEDGTLKRFYANGDVQEISEFNGGVINAANSKYLKPVKKETAAKPAPSAKPAPAVSSEEKTNDAIRFKPNGYNTLYDRQLRLSQSGEYRNGKLFNGKRYKYATNGELDKIEIFVQGRFAGYGVITEGEK